MSERAFRILLSPQGDPLSPEAWVAEIPELRGCVSHGSTPAEALESIEDAKGQWLATARDLGYEIPEPESDLDEFSGKFTVRLPRSLHRQLTHMAMIEGVSLNQYVVYLLGTGRTGAGGMEPVHHYRMIRQMTETVQREWSRHDPGVLAPQGSLRTASAAYPILGRELREARDRVCERRHPE